jgi:putative ABC transport system permease protein
VGALFQDVRFAIRSLRRQPGFVVVGLATLALGIGTATAMFTIVNGVLLKPLPFQDPDSLAIVQIEGAEGGVFPLPDADFLALRANRPAFQHVAVFTRTSFNMTGSGTPEIASAAWASGDFFATLGVRPLLGRLLVTSDDAPGAVDVVVLSHAFWIRRFNAVRHVVGQTLRLDDVPCTIVGVTPPGFTFPRREIDLWRNRIIRTPPRRGPFYLSEIVRLRDASNLGPARANLEVVTNSIKQQYGPGDWHFRIRPLTDALLSDARTPLYILFSAVGFLLLIALANVANLMVARAASRQREVALRAALGAGRGRLARQLITESVLIAMVGGALGVAAAGGLVRVLMSLGQEIVPRVTEIHIDARVMLFAVGISVLAGLLFGTAPALRSSSRDLVEPLRDSQRASAGTSRRRFQSTLVVIEIALALVLSAGAGLLVQSLVRLQHVDVGFSPDRLVTFSLSLPQTRYPDATASRAFYQRLLERLVAVPGVENAAIAVSLPPDQVTVTDNFTAEGQQYLRGQSAPVGMLVIASESLFSTLRIPLIRGRMFDERDGPTAEPVVIVSRTLADRYYLNGDAVGRRFRTGGPERPKNPWMRVIGIVDDVKYFGLAEAAPPAFYLPLEQHPWTDQYVVVRAAIRPESVVALINQAVWSIDRDLPLARLRTMDEIMERAAAGPRFRTFVLTCFGVLGLILALVGVYGVMSYAVAQRTHELGVRAALGARPADLMTLVLKDSGWLAAAGVAIGTVAALAVTSAMEKLLFGVTPRDPLTLISVAGLLAAAALGASWLPARRASRADPLTTMRNV